MFEFRPLARSDLALVHAWMNAPHAKRWFGHPREEVDRVYGASIRGEETFEAYLALRGGVPVGLVNRGFFGDAPEMARAYGVTDPNTANCDALLGVGFHSGAGAEMIRAFLEQIVFRDPRTTSVVIDPNTDNAIAIRAYEKAGFRFLRAVPDDGEGGQPLYLMELTREGFERGGHDAPSFVLRPSSGSARDVEIADAIDDDACEAYSAWGLPFDFSRSHPFFAHERARWSASAEAGRLLFACEGDERVGFVALGHVDGRPHLEQLSVRRASMRRGLGRAMLLRALRWAVRAKELWLTTYDHVPWNAPWYERVGFERVADRDAPRELQRLLEAARSVLPAPEHQVAMVCRGEYFQRWMR